MLALFQANSRLIPGKFHLSESIDFCQLYGGLLEEQNKDIFYFCESCYSS